MNDIDMGIRTSYRRRRCTIKLGEAGDAHSQESMPVERPTARGRSETQAPNLSRRSIACAPSDGCVVASNTPSWPTLCVVIVSVTGGAAEWVCCSMWSLLLAVAPLEQRASPISIRDSTRVDSMGGLTCAEAE